MNARVPRLSLRAISLAMLLAIVDQTQGFTIRYEYVRPQDMMAEESSISEVRHELKRNTDDSGEFQVAPIVTALPLTMPTENLAETTIVNDIALTTSNINTTNPIETTISPNDQHNISNVQEIQNTTANVEVKTPLVRDLRDTDTTTLPPQETTTIITTTGVTNQNIEASGNEEKIQPLGTDNISSAVDTTMSPIIVTEPSNNTDMTTTTTVSEEPVTWKKYTEIERKPVNISDEVIPARMERVGDSLNAHTTESRVRLEKVFNLAPDIQSLQELKNHLLQTSNSVPTEIIPTEMVSKRAGYLDHTIKTDSAITTTVNASQVGNEIQLDGTAYEMESYNENNYTHNKTSHTQMVYDALKEELLAEAHIEDKIRFTTPPSYERSKVEFNEITPTPNDQQQVDDYLTVKPINNDKKTILYTVSPNYKPLKKIEVQPMKPFMRDPDDNSWRNESLSSLGIVFKGKNSSKAFTEVLKNKTETVMSNTTEPEKVLVKVDLRDRLEKIAEKRKKKKKLDKFGNPEYTDYEENTSGDMHTSKEKSEISLTTTPLPLSFLNPGISLETVMTTSSDDGSSKKLKSNKPIHKYKVSDYYDAKEDNMDYPTFPNIDILKSTPRPRVQWPVTQKILDNAPPTRPYLPDRQPTVQYFPPRPKTSNDHDFDHKFSIFEQATQPRTNEPPRRNEPIETYTKKNVPAKFVTADKSHISNENQNLAIQHVEYRPVGVHDDGLVIRHYKDLLEAVAKDEDYDIRNGPYPTSPMLDGGKSVKSDEYDYGPRKEGLNKFVDYFNQNHERFKADFPVIFNTSVVHGAESGKVLASSSAMFKRLYNYGARDQPHVQNKEQFGFSDKPLYKDCDNITVELSPAYELHYYVPEQEEMATLPYGYRTT